ncbi:hypothetical protein FGO68_gene16120 [Halteria grandinella]|uniref:Uncharacterized protein n=1 Tax=Halteria grandinella TaxID=5974 RepID=A0A8J8NQG5_HALGN|nr:hypothetical protein FGO68_gene16120 [Halteria grandinella]
MLNRSPQKSAFYDSFFGANGWNNGHTWEFSLNTCYDSGYHSFHLGPVAKVGIRVRKAMHDKIPCYHHCIYFLGIGVIVVFGIAQDCIHQLKGGIHCIVAQVQTEGEGA